MNACGKSDNSIGPENSPNKGGSALAPAEGTEERGLAARNPRRQTRARTQSRQLLRQKLNRVRQAASRDKESRLTALWHHVYDRERLREEYFNLKRTAAAGVDGVTWQQYGDQFEVNLEDLSARLQRGAYRAKPVKRVQMTKEDGGKRPIGIPTLEDKLVQQTASRVLSTVFEVDFAGFSYGFRPGRSQHNALDALCVGIRRKKVNWILDADIRGFFDTLDHGWLMKFVEHRIADRRVARHIKKWLNAGVLEDGKRIVVKEGTPQGGSISPLLANIYLHYVFDLWVSSWRQKRARGEMIVVRYADDFVVGFQEEADAKQFQDELKARLLKFNLELHPEKTRLLEFGRFAARDRARRGEGKPETFDFLGFTHICGETRNGKFQVARRTSRKKRRSKLRQIKVELRRRLHDPIPEVGKWLRSVVEGHNRYYAVPGNSAALRAFRQSILRAWRQVLKRRSQKARNRWDRMRRLGDRWLPTPRILRPYPELSLYVTTRGRSPVR